MFCKMLSWRGKTLSHNDLEDCKRTKVQNWISLLFLMAAKRGGGVHQAHKQGGLPDLDLSFLFCFFLVLSRFSFSQLPPFLDCDASDSSLEKVRFQQPWNDASEWSLSLDQLQRRLWQYKKEWLTRCEGDSCFSRGYGGQIWGSKNILGNSNGGLTNGGLSPKFLEKIGQKSFRKIPWSFWVFSACFSGF